MDNNPKISEMDFQREKLRRDLQDVITLLDEASSEQDAHERKCIDLRAAMRLVSVEPKKFVLAVDPEVAAHYKNKGESEA